MSFQMMLFKDAPAELQSRYPDAGWFVLSDKDMDGNALEQRELILAQMRKKQGISFERQDREFDDKIVFVGTKSVFGGLI